MGFVLKGCWGCPCEGWGVGGGCVSLMINPLPLGLCDPSLGWASWDNTHAYFTHCYGEIFTRVGGAGSHGLLHVFLFPVNEKQDFVYWDNFCFPPINILHFFVIRYYNSWAQQINQCLYIYFLSFLSCDLFLLGKKCQFFKNFYLIPSCLSLCWLTTTWERKNPYEYVFHDGRSYLFLWLGFHFWDIVKKKCHFYFIVINLDILFHVFFLFFR